MTTSIVECLHCHYRFNYEFIPSASFYSIRLANGILIGLIVITPVAGYVSPGSAVVLGVLGSILFLLGEKLFQRVKWFTDPVGLFPGHFLGGIFGFIMVAFFTQYSYASFGGGSGLPNGLLFGGGMQALHQLGLQLLAIPVVLGTVFVLSYVFMWIISKGIHGIIREYTDAELRGQKIKSSESLYQGV